LEKDECLKAHAEKRPGDVIGAAIMVAKIATGEIEDNQLALANQLALVV
jgi:hypothetical protein